MEEQQLFNHKLELLHEFCKLHGLTIWGATANNAFQIDSGGNFVTLRVFDPSGWDAEDKYSRDQLRTTTIPQKPSE